MTFERGLKTLESLMLRLNQRQALEPVKFEGQDQRLLCCRGR